ncbi:energy transducer TonB [Mucilaginibacter sp. OK268]|jgi:protein TonB|uniref:energy transducer TonB n=1 Tax=Mucilaginibacter sp. OK268 TaxID=1881048 RepID=UPI0015A37270|nr:energy transducer TonB [Mucilaginibacter sp. OK268]
MKIFIPLIFLITPALFCSAQSSDVKQVPVDTSANTIYSSVEKMAQFPGGILEFFKFIDKNLKYPEKDRKAGLEGTVVVTFVVERDGSLTNIIIAKSPTPEMAKETLRLIKLSPKWEPASQNGRNVRVHFPVAVKFKLPKP